MTGRKKVMSWLEGLAEPDWRVFHSDSEVQNIAQSALTLLNEQEAIVRCKDCKHGEPGACGDGVDCDGVWHDDDWFCADGERKKGR